MDHIIDYIKDGAIEGSEYWPGSFAQAKQLAKTAVKTDCADRTEIRNQSGKLVFHYPRVLSAA